MFSFVFTNDFGAPCAEYTWAYAAMLEPVFRVKGLRQSYICFQWQICFRDYVQRSACSLPVRSRQSNIIF